MQELHSKMSEKRCVHNARAYAFFLCPLQERGSQRTVLLGRRVDPPSKARALMSLDPTQGPPPPTPNSTAFPLGIKTLLHPS